MKDIAIVANDPNASGIVKVIAVPSCLMEATLIAPHLQLIHLLENFAIKQNLGDT